MKYNENLNMPEATVSLTVEPTPRDEGTLALAFYRALYPDSHSDDSEARIAGKRAIDLLGGAGIKVYIACGEARP